MPDNSDDLSSSFERARSATANLDAQLNAQERQVAADNSRRVGRDRSWIAITIIATYAVAVIGFGLYVALSPITCAKAATNCNPATIWSGRAEILSDLLITSVIPIVTLMLGFYFGTEATRAKEDTSS